MQAEHIMIALDSAKEVQAYQTKIAETTICAHTLQDKPIPERNWVAEGWILNRCVTALYGDGGVGKSLLAMQLMTCVALGIPFFGIPTSQMNVFGYFCEDSQDELHRRQADINRLYGVDFSRLESIHWQSRVGCDNVLMTFINNGIGTASEAYAYLRSEVLKVGARLVIIDTAADTFGGNEIIRPQVRQFINLLGKLALEIDGAVVLCAHPSASGLANNSGTGGSTAWNNTVRSRMYLSRPTTSKGDEMSEEDAKDLRELTKMKSNYSSVGDKIMLRWHEGAFDIAPGHATDIVSQLERKKQDREDDEVFLAFLDELTAQGRTASDSKQAGNYAPKIIRLLPAGKNISSKRLEDAMHRLFANGTIDKGFVKKGTDRKKKDGLRRRPKDVCGEVQHGDS